MIFKNLTKLDEVKRVPSSSNRIENKKPGEVKKEPDQFYKNLADIEPEANDSLTTRSEANDFLGVSKYSNPSCFLPNKNTETQRFTDSILEEFLITFTSQNNIEDQRWILKTKPEQNKCKCLQDFNYNRSNCF